MTEERDKTKSGRQSNKTNFEKERQLKTQEGEHAVRGKGTVIQCAFGNTQERERKIEMERERGREREREGGGGREREGGRERPSGRERVKAKI